MTSPSDTFDPSEATTSELLSLPTCKKIVATFAGMQDLSAFVQNKHKLDVLVRTIGSATEVPPALSQYDLDQVHHAAEMVSWCVLKDGGVYADVLVDILGIDLDYESDAGSGD